MNTQNRAQLKHSSSGCVFCGARATTKDHIPSRNLFPDTKGLQFRTVPSCEGCNQGFSKDEEFFRDHIVGFALDKSISAYSLFESKIRRSIRQRPKLGQYMFSKMKVVDLKTLSGIYIGKRTVMRMEKGDWDRIHNVVDKTIRGLVYLEFGRPLPKDFVIRHVSTTGPRLKKHHKSLLDTITWRVGKNEHIFLYGFGKVPDSLDSVWITQYFGTVVLLSFVMRKGVREELKNEGYTSAVAKTGAAVV